MSGGELKWKSIFSQLADPGICRRWAQTTGADLGIYLGGQNQVLQAKVEGEARIEGAKRPRIEGEARVEGAKRVRIEGEAQTEGDA